MSPPGAMIDSQRVKVDGTPTASMALSTPRLPVSASTCSTTSLSPALMQSVAPKRLATSSRLSSRSIMMIRAGE
ncbi:hypothetical protein D3C81_1741920 [compost metagenome]